MIIYEPKENLNVDGLLDTSKYEAVIDKINTSSLSDSQKKFLTLAASRFIRFRYEKIADYYCTTQSDEMKKFIEELHLVVVDYDSAIENGYFEFQEEYKKLLRSVIDE